MKRVASLNPVFVEFIPEELRDGELYITIAYATAVHRCCCGCGTEVVTPFSPTDWSLIFEGVSVSLEPSIGNWSFPCRSHYWISRNRVIWAEAWSDRRIALGRAADRTAKDAHFSLVGGERQTQPPAPDRPAHRPYKGFSPSGSEVSHASEPQQDPSARRGANSSEGDER